MTTENKEALKLAKENFDIVCKYMRRMDDINQTNYLFNLDAFLSNMIKEMHPLVMRDIES